MCETCKADPCTCPAPDPPAPDPPPNDPPATTDDDADDTPGWFKRWQEAQVTKTKESPAPKAKDAPPEVVKMEVVETPPAEETPAPTRRRKRLRLFGR